MLDDELINIDFINTNKICRKWGESTLLEVQKLRRELEDTYLEMSSTKEEIDKEIDAFIKKMMIVLNTLRDNLLEDFHTRKNIKKNISSFVESSLDFFKIKLGEKEYNWEDTSNLKCRNKDENIKVYETVDDIRIVFAYIYALPNMRMDKINMQQKLHDMRKDYQVGTNEYTQIMTYYLAISNGKKYESIRKIYEAAIEELEEKKKSRA